MVDIWEYYGRGSVKIRLTDTDGRTYVGTVENIEDAEENEENEDGIVISENGNLIFFRASEVSNIAEEDNTN